MMMPPQDRMAVNAALETLISGDASVEVAQTVVNLCAHLPKRASLSGELNKTKTYDGEKFEGATPKHGQMDYDSGGERTEHVEKTFGVEKERIGHYRVWRDAAGVIGFHRFWKSSLTTEGTDKVDQYRLGFDPSSMSPTWFGVERTRIVFQLGRIQFVRLYIEPIFGEVPYREQGGWGLYYSDFE